jgi:hypothetical protein
MKMIVVSGKCLKFDGTNDYILNPFTRPITPTTVGFWEKRGANVSGREQFCWLWSDGGI